MTQGTLWWRREPSGDAEYPLVTQSTHWWRREPTGDAGNPLAQINGTQFSSDDVDNDGNDQEECADKQDAGFWHQETCGTCTLTGGGSDFNCSTLPSGQEELKMSQMCLQCIDASIGRGKCVGVCMYLIDNKGHGQGQFSEGATSIGKGCELFYRRQWESISDPTASTLCLNKRSK